MRARTAAINELKAIVVTADEDLRSGLRGLSTTRLVSRCARFRDNEHRSLNVRHTRLAMRALARRIEHLDDEVADHDRLLKTLIDEVAPNS